MTLNLQTGTENETLRTVSKRVPNITGELRNFALDMIKTMETEKGVGLAAPQVGRNIRMIICKLNPEGKNEVIVPMINPVIVDFSDEKELGEEGCLSLPETWGKVERSKNILFKFQNLKGSEQTLELEDFNARIVQHEIDHLDGILFTDKAIDIEKGKAPSGGEDGPHI
ncbi:peptide deformylase [Candidatus Peregrinibacteria bacterium]|jgi:peptide deformylase|nr:peptide deformylase [Candidatus Peregrinibacteria bacterium]MBT4631781.1 peptide deformylase [Candidatus Peregrinibacteria bacterium]MBT5516844.1 peptide deformylase [Candidatus Peregrinibacteria bacterium]MBT5824494.1 peptide deformylase [Candidatus Peregrinibacteria bacterium]